MLRRPLVIAGALVALNLAVFAPVRHHQFVQLDDPAYVTENPDVRGGLTAHGVGWAFTTGHAANWHPITWLSHMADVQIFGLDAGAHHVTNLVLHMLNTLLLLALLLRLTGAIGRSAFVAALFAVHPLHVESVAWVAERKDVLSTLFWMLTLLAYVAWVRRPRWTRYAVVVVCFALGLMAKPMLVTLPLVLMLLDVWPLGRLGVSSEVRGAAAPPRPSDSVPARIVPLVREKLPLFALAATSSVVTYVVQQHGGAASGLDVTPMGLRVSNALLSYVNYLAAMFWPAGLTVIYGFPDSIPGWQVAGAVAILAAITFVAIRSVRRRPYVTVGWLWYLCTLIPTIGLIRVGVQSHADRYTYVPLIGIFIMIAWAVPDLSGRTVLRRHVMAAVAAIVVLGCAVAARKQVGYWQDDVLLWTRATMLTLKVDEFTAHLTLGRTLTEKGRLDEAAEHFSDAVRLQPASAEAHLHLGVARSRQGKTTEAIAAFAEAARLQPDLEPAHVNLAIAFANAGRWDDAIREFNAVLRLDPGNEQARRAVNELVARRGRF